MSGPQFVHLQTFSRKPNPAGQSVEQVLGELVRLLEYSLHVSNPAPPELVDGISPVELIRQHNAMVESVSIEVLVKGKTQHRAVRKDRHTLMTAVASYPLSWDQIKGNPEEMQALREWETRNVRFFKKLFGHAYKSTIRHTDESYPHLHIYALPEEIPGIDAIHLHPGKRAKREIDRLAREQGATPREAVARGNRALKEAMRDFQDDYFAQVGEPSGLLRFGPKRQRLSRKEYQAQKHAARLRSASSLEARSNELQSKELEVSNNSKGLSALQDELSKLQRSLEIGQQHLAEENAKLSKALQGTRDGVAQLQDHINALSLAIGLDAHNTVGEGLYALDQFLESLQNDMRAGADDGVCGPSF